MKGNWKKLWGFLLLSSILLISLTACGKKEKGKETDNSVVENGDEKDDQTPTPEPTEAPKDLKGTTIVIGDWWTTDPNPEPTNKREEDTQRYREEFMEKYNFTITRANLGTFTEYAEIVATSIMSGILKQIFFGNALRSILRLLYNRDFYIPLRLWRILILPRKNRISRLRK